MTEETKNEELTVKSQSKEDRMDLEKFVNFLERLISIPKVNEMITVHIENQRQHSKWVIVAKTLITLTIVAVSSWLSYNNSFNPTLGVIFGSIVGYILGNKSA